jgi:photosystem II stability/assembly factor-like uncharacterized protein
MADRPDDLDAWLNDRVDSLPPPPGTFELIKRRARRRKYRKLAITAGAAAVIVAAAVTVPQVVNLPLLNPSTTGVAAAHSSSPSPTAASASPASASPSSSTIPMSVPVNFRPSSVTFVGTDTGFVIGQASTPGHCATQYCTSVARTDDAGRTWTGLPAPLTGAPDGATGVSQIRFLNTEDGWAFGPELFATHDGGHSWAQVATSGLRVTDLETVGDRAFALFASCAGTGPTFAAQCTSFTLYSSPAGTDDWAPLGAATSGLTGGTAASLVLTGIRGYLLAPDGMLYAGPVDGAAWQPVASVPCPVGSAQPDGQPTGALLAAATGVNLVLACTPAPISGGLQKKLIFASADGGASWHQIEPVTAGPGFVATVQGVASSLAASPAGSVVLGTSAGIVVLPAGSTTWQQATVTGAPAGGFGFVGMTTDEQGVALPANPAVGAVWFTFDGGQSWQPSPVRGA